MMKLERVGWLSLALLLAAGCGDGGPDDFLELLSETGLLQYEGEAVIANTSMSGGVTRVDFDPASGAICLFGSDFRVFHQAGQEQDRLLMILDGGGACWGDLCNASPDADEDLGIVATLLPLAASFIGNPNLMFVPYCDGSAFIGDNIVDRPDGTTRYHHGQRNLQAALDVALANYPNVQQILILGLSAGGVGTHVALPMTRLTYPDVELIVANDSGPGLQNFDRPQDVQDRIDDWQFSNIAPPGCVDCDPMLDHFTGVYRWMLDRDPNLRIAVLSHLADNVIADSFLQLGAGELQALLDQEYGALTAEFPDTFRRFMIPGTEHVLLSRILDNPSGGDVNMTDWLKGLIDGISEEWPDQFRTN